MDVILTLIAFIIGFVLVLITIPPIVRVAKAKRLFDTFEERKIHKLRVPPMGGVAIFIGLTISSIVATDGIPFDSLKYIIASVIIMFFIGLKDDLMNITARKKLMVQIFAAVILVALGNVRFTHLHGIFGIEEIGYFASITLSIFAVVVIINAFNLIDGIDGLASGLAMFSVTAFGIWFLITGNTQFAILSFALVGSLAGFFIFNVFGTKNKLFMGDTGSLIIGLVISALVVKFNEFNINASAPYAFVASPAISLALIVVPLVDTLRVMTIRIYNKKSPFSADNNHVHHRLLVLAPGHLKVTLIIMFINILIVFLALFLNQSSLNVNYQFLIVLFTGILLSFIPSYILKLKSSRKRKYAKQIKPIG